MREKAKIIFSKINFLYFLGSVTLIIEKNIPLISVLSPFDATHCKVDLAPTFGFNPFRLTSRRLGRRGHVGEGTSIHLFHF
jgi:hypothetical protein